MSFENIILGLVIVYLIYKIRQAIHKSPTEPKQIKMLSSVNGQLVEVQVKNIEDSVQLLSTLVEQDFPTFAKMAFSRISQAFASGRLKEIKNDLTPKVFKIFQEAISQREAKNQHMEYSLFQLRMKHCLKRKNNKIVILLPFFWA